MKVLTASLVLAFFANGSVAHPIRQGRPCNRLFTVAMATGAARAVYHGTASVSQEQRRLLGRLQRCQRNPLARLVVGAAYRRLRHAWYLRRNPPLNGPATASWYEDGGGTACGFHATYGFASLFLPCGARVLFRGPGGEAVGIMQDHGPYVGGRLFDLNPALKSAIGCSDLCTVYWH